MNKRIFSKIRQRVYTELFKRDFSVVVAGLGRSGTTLVFNSLYYNNFFKPTEFCANLNELQNNTSKGFVYKTHDLPPDTLPSSIKLIYLFGNPMNTVISTHRRINEWGSLHHKHLHSNNFKTNDNILFEDTLMLNKHFDNWYRKQAFSFITVKYESLYNKSTLNVLNDYLGFELKLFPQKTRTTNWKNHPSGKIVFETYKDLYYKIEDAEDVKIWTPK